MERRLREAIAPDFELGRQLGRGGMAMVYLAKEVGLDRMVAIKVLPPELTFGHGVERFRREAVTAASLDHPHIVPIHRVSSTGGLFWYAMKYVEGRTLDDFLKERTRLPLNETVGILGPVADALDYAHARGVIHRDIKPMNVMVDQHGRAVVTDFGIAKALSAGALTSSGSVLGTPVYMSPEQGKGKTVSGPSDQYSVGIMAYEMLSGQLPFESDTPFNLIYRHCTEPPPPLDVLNPALPEHACAAVHKALAKSPEERFDTVSAFVHALAQPTAFPPAEPPSKQRAVTIGRGATPARSPPTPSVQTIRTKRRLMPAAVGILSAAGLIALAVASFPTLSSWFERVRGGSETATPSATAEQEFASGGAGAAEPQAAEPVERPSDPPPTARNPSGRPATPRSPPPAAPSTPQTGRLTVTQLPANGAVLLDGVARRGATVEATPGRHELRVSAPGMVGVIDTITILAGQTSTYRFVPVPLAPAVLRISLPGPAAAVYVDDVLRHPGTNRLEIDSLTPGTHRLRFVLEGHETLDTTITLGPGEIRRFTHRMSRSN